MYDTYISIYIYIYRESEREIDRSNAPAETPAVQAIESENEAIRQSWSSAVATMPGSLQQKPRARSRVCMHAERHTCVMRTYMVQRERKRERERERDREREPCFVNWAQRPFAQARRSRRGATPRGRSPSLKEPARPAPKVAIDEAAVQRIGVLRNVCSYGLRQAG